MAMSYGYVYVAAVAMGANQNQCLKAFLEAEAYDGPSLIIAYSPCINHGIDMTKTQAEEKLAVDTGYWILYRYNPLLGREGKNPLTLDSKEPKLDYQTFLKNEVRYRTLAQQHPEISEVLFKQAAEEAAEEVPGLQEDGRIGPPDRTTPDPRSRHAPAAFFLSGERGAGRMDVPPQALEER